MLPLVLLTPPPLAFLALPLSGQQSEGLSLLRFQESKRSPPCPQHMQWIQHSLKLGPFLGCPYLTKSSLTDDVKSKSVPKILRNLSLNLADEINGNLVLKFG